MVYIVKMRMTIIKEFDVEINGPGTPVEICQVDNVVDAMDIAEDLMNDGLGLGDCCLTIRETPWAPVSVNEKEK